MTRLPGRFLKPWERLHDRYRGGQPVRRKSTRKRKRKEQRDWRQEVAEATTDSLPGTPGTPPRNVRITYLDGQTLPLEVVYDGVRNGIHHWRATGVAPLRPGWSLSMDLLPAKSAVTLDVVWQVDFRQP